VPIRVRTHLECAVCWTAYRRGAVCSFREEVRGPAAGANAAAGGWPVCGLPTGRVLTVTPELDLVSGLLAMLAAVLAVWSVRLDDALTGGVRALRC